MNEIDRVGQLGSNSANLYDSGPLVGLFIISRQHTQAWNITLLRRWVLAAGRKQGVRRCGRNANECPLSSLRFHLLLWHNTALQSNSSLASGLIAVLTAARVFSLILSHTSLPLITTYNRINLLCYGPTRQFAVKTVHRQASKQGFLIYKRRILRESLSANRMAYRCVTCPIYLVGVQEKRENSLTVKIRYIV